MSTSSLDRDLAADLVRRYGLTSADLLVETGSGRGAFLLAAKSCGVRVLGVEENPAKLAQAWAAGIDTVAGTFTPAVAAGIRAKYGPVKLLVARGPSSGDAEIARLLVAGSRCLSPAGAIALMESGVNAVVELRPDVERRRAA